MGSGDPVIKREKNASRTLGRDSGAAVVVVAWAAAAAADSAGRAWAGRVAAVAAPAGGVAAGA